MVSQILSHMYYFVESPFRRLYPFIREIIFPEFTFLHGEDMFEILAFKICARLYKYNVNLGRKAERKDRRTAWIMGERINVTCTSIGIYMMVPTGEDF